MQQWLILTPNPYFYFMAYINIERLSGVVTLTMNRPDKFNSFVREMAFELQKALDDCHLDPEVRCIVITGAGKAFCAGQDLQEAIESNGLELSKIVSEHFNPIIQRIRKNDKPIIAAINGVAAGAGANIALACDITIASRSASFIQAFSKIGLIPDSGGTYTLPRLVGMQKASALMMLGEKVNATEAERLGMIYKVVDDEQFKDEVEKIAQTLAKMPTKAFSLTKKALNKTWQNNLHDQLLLEDKLQTEAGLSDDYQEGVNAFLEKRKANFKGQ
jgi:2-(1,2-epoxy-1,2-dihydrophenyl)acetyl-CoA isomerase